MNGFSILRIACVTLAIGLASQGLTAQQTTPALSAATRAQSPNPSAVPVPQATPNGDPTLMVRNDKAIEAFEPGINEEYTLGAGDEITLNFPGNPDLKEVVTIGPDGRISLPPPSFKEIKVVDLTRTEAQKAIAEGLKDFFTGITVNVSVNKYASNKVRVLGYVQHPGEVLFDGTPTLLDAIGKAGLISPQATVAGVTTNIGSGIPETCTVYRGNSTAVQVRLREMLMTGNNLADLRLRRNDIVYVPEPQQLFVSVLGQVSKPGTIALTKQSTLTTVLAEAGCCTELGGFNPEVHILQPSTGKDIKVKYKEIMTLAGQQEYTLHSGDVIIIPVSGFQKVTSVIAKISPAATMISFAALAGGW